MRIISGRYRGRKLYGPEGLTTRPTLDRIKENLFNLLPNVYGMKVLDLFAGSGGLGIEALSRGAESVDFCDNNSEAIKFLKRNLDKTEGTVRVHECDYLRALEKFERNGDKFDLVFLDPPYKSGFYEGVLRELISRKLIFKDSLVVVENDTNSNLPFAEYGYEIFKERNYGAVRLTIIKEKT